MSGRRDEGLTVIELLLSMSILTVIMASISSAMIVFFQNGSYTIGRDDHSAGAAILATYMDRDLLSAESGVTGSTIPCDGSTAKDLVLTWSQWTASTTDVTPKPGDTYHAAYDLVSGGGTHSLQRWYCKGTSVLNHTVVLGDLSSADFSLAAAAACGPGSTSLALSVASYRDDALADYSYSGCLKGRLS